VCGDPPDTSGHSRWLLNALRPVFSLCLFYVSSVSQSFYIGSGQVIPSSHRGPDSLRKDGQTIHSPSPAQACPVLRYAACMEKTSRHSAPLRNVIRHGNRTVLIRPPAAHDAMERDTACVITAYCDRGPRFNLLRIRRCPIQSRTPAVHFPDGCHAARVVMACTYISPRPFVNDRRNIGLAIRIVTPAQSIARTVHTTGVELSRRD
jgi:hypothetical protein